MTKHLAPTDPIDTSRVVIASKRGWDKPSEQERGIPQKAATETILPPARDGA